MTSKTEVAVDSRRIELSNPDKLLFPDAHLSKQDLVDYYRNIAGHMLPHLKDRPLTLQRFPDGIEKDGFYQKDAADFFPDWIKTCRIHKRQGGSFDAPLCDDAATLVYLANLASITPHIWLSTIGNLDQPDRFVFDLDPPGEEFAEVKFAARQIRDYFRELDIDPFLMTTGSKGLHVVIPLRPDKGFDTVRELSQRITRILAERHPDRLTTEVRKNKRAGRLFLDVARNAFGQTVVAPYGVRARAGAPVATPIDWHELGRLPHARKYTVKNIFRRLSSKEDPWRDFNRKRYSLRKIEEGVGDE